MATIAQIEANRLNALHSTGPTSLEGKAAVRFNALKHGVDAHSLTIPGEDAAARTLLESDYYRRFDPQGADEQYLVETLVESDWVQRRLALIETTAFTILLEDPALPAENKLGAIFLQNTPGSKVLDRIFRRQQAARRDYFRALKELQARQKERLVAAAALQAFAPSVQPPAAPQNRVCSAPPPPPQPTQPVDPGKPADVRPAAPIAGPVPLR